MISRVAAVGILAILASACGDSGTGPSGTSPTITAVSPAQGTTFGGTPITITGTNFVAPVTVSVGNAAATSVTVLSPTSIQAVTAAHSQGAADVSVGAGAASGKLKNGYTYVAPSVTNTPPVVTAIRVQGTRPFEPSSYANIDERVNVTVDVTDAETPLSGLTFEWSALRGTFSGTGNAVTFAAPHSAETLNLRVVVVEKYSVPGPTGLPEQRENRVTADTPIRIHDEATEIGGMAKKFLDLFSQSPIAPETVVQDFQDGCGANGTGKRDELEQIRNNRKNYVILPGWVVGSPQVTVSFNGVSPYRARRADGWAAVNASWTSRCLVADPSIGCAAVGAVPPTVSGIDWVTSRYDSPSDRWWLCDSDFNGDVRTLRAFGSALRGFID